MATERLRERGTTCNLCGVSHVWEGLKGLASGLVIIGNKSPVPQWLTIQHSPDLTQQFWSLVMCNNETWAKSRMGGWGEGRAGHGALGHGGREVNASLDPLPSVSPLDRGHSYEMCSFMVIKISPKVALIPFVRTSKKMDHRLRDCLFRLF